MINDILHHVEFKSRFDGRWIGARVGHSMTKTEAEEMIEMRKADHPDTEYRVARGACPA